MGSCTCNAIQAIHELAGLMESQSHVGAFLTETREREREREGERERESDLILQENSLEAKLLLHFLKTETWFISNAKQNTHVAKVNRID